MTSDFVSNFNILGREDDTIQIPNLFTANDFLRDIERSYKTGDDLGLDFGMLPFRNKFTWRPTDLNVWSGYMNEGKSQLLLYAAMTSSIVHNWKWLVHSPENMPEYIFFMDLIHMAIGVSLDIRNPHRPSMDQIRKAAEWVSEHFLLLEDADGFTIDGLLKIGNHVYSSHRINGMIIDPWSQLIHDQGSGEREDQYISRKLTSVKGFAKRTGVNVNIVAHQVTTRINKTTGNFDKPNIMHISGGAMFGNKADNTISVWRPYRFSEPNDPTVIVNFDKIKKKKLTGKGGEVHIKFDLKTNRYYWHETNEYGDGEVVTSLNKLNFI